VALEESTFAFGGARYPLTPETDKELLVDVDPGLARALDFFAWGIEHYLGARLRAQAALEKNGGYAWPSAVRLKETIEPLPFLFSEQFKFPLFALYRQREEWNEHTTEWDKSTATWVFSYVLPPLMPVQQGALNPILRGVSAVIRRLAHQGYDPAYSAGEPVWKLAGIQAARLIETRYGSFEKVEGSGAFYRSVSGQLVVLEREMPVESAFDLFGGASLAVDLGINSAAAPDVAQTASHEPSPTVTSITPNFGPAAGGTAVTVIGTGFVVGTYPSLTIGDVPANDVTVVNATTVTATTRARAAGALLDVIVENPDGQQGVLPATFTYAP
jgi:IPT/TIG domain